MDGFCRFHIHSLKIPFFYIAVIVSAGIMLAVFLPALPHLYVIAILSAVSAFLVIAGRGILVAIGWFLVGFSWSLVYCFFTVQSLLPLELDGKDVAISGHLVDFPKLTEKGWQFDFYADELNGKVRLSIFDSPGSDTEPPDFYCQYHLVARLKMPRGLVNFGQFDYQGWLIQAGYVATGYVRSVQQCEEHETDKVTAIRITIARWLNSFSISEYSKSTLMGLLIGSYANIDSFQWQILRDSGTIHLLSVSGLHIVIVSTFFYAITLYLARIAGFPAIYYPANCWAAFFAILSAIYYSLIAGFSVATQRSLIMVIIACIQVMIYGRFVFSSSLIYSGLVVLVYNPLCVISSGFWFSFVATSLLLLTGHGLLSLSKTQLIYSMASGLRLQWYLFLMMMPVLLFVYGKVPLLSLPLNLLAVPWVSFLALPLGFFSLLFMPFSSFIAENLLLASAWTLDVYWYFMQLGVGFGSSWQLVWGDVQFFSLFLAMIGLFLFCLSPAGFPLRFSGLILCLPVIFPFDTSPGKSEVEVNFLDVGQGLSVIVRTANHVLVYDAGDRISDRFDVGRDIVVPALRHLRIRHLDMLMISHADRDHSGGAPGLLDEYPALHKWSGTPDMLQYDDSYLPCTQGMHWRWDGVDFYVLHPFDNVNQGQKDNDRSCVLMIAAGKHRLLLTGDIEKNAELAMISAGVELSADVLLVPHHGSKTSSSPAFLAAVDPSLGVISAGYRNRFHHPAQSVVSHYQERGAKLFNSAETGAIRVRLSDTGVVTSLALCDRPVFWLHDRYRQYCGN